MTNQTFINKKTFLSFKLKSELFAVGVSCVLEVLEKQPITSIPKAPEFLAGVINFRGEVLPVIDIRKKFNMPERHEHEKYVIIVLELNMNGGNMQIGAMVDGVKDVMELSDDSLKDIPTLGYRYNSEFIEGMYTISDGFMMVLNFGKILSEEEVRLVAETA